MRVREGLGVGNKWRRLAYRVVPVDAIEEEERHGGNETPEHEQANRGGTACFDTAAVGARQNKKAWVFRGLLGRLGDEPIPALAPVLERSVVHSV